MIQKLTRRERQSLLNLEAVCLHQQAPPIEFLPEKYHPIREDRVLFFAGPGWLPHFHRKDLFILSNERIREHNPLDRPESTAMYGYRVWLRSRRPSRSFTSTQRSAGSSSGTLISAIRRR